jgi:hypothetical protein
MITHLELSAFLTTPLHPPPLLILPLLEKFLFAQRLTMGMVRVGMMMHAMVLQVALIGVVAGETTHNTPE